MSVVIAGGHGQIALRLGRLLAADGEKPVGLIRNPAQTADLAAAGMVPVVADLERLTVAELAAHLTGADAVVFAAGAGPGSGGARKDSMDRDGAGLLADAAEQAGVRRYLMVSALRVDAPPRPDEDEVFRAYLAAKRAADDDLRRRDLDWTVLRPGRLTDTAGTGRVTLGGSPPYGEVPRDDVAAVLRMLLREPRTAGLTLDLVGGEEPVAAAVAAACDERG